MHFLILLVALSSLSISAAAHPVLGRWEFDREPIPFAADGCTVSLENGALRVAIGGADVQLVTPFVKAEAPIRLRMRMRSDSGAFGDMEIFWRTTQDSSQNAWWGTWRMMPYPLQHDGAWHEYDFPLPTEPGPLQVRFDPGWKAGHAEIDWVSLEENPYPSSVLAASRNLPAILSIEDETLKASFTGADHLLRVQDKRTGRDWRINTARTQGLLTAVEPAGAHALRFTLYDASTSATYHSHASLEGNGVLSFTLECARPDVRFSALRQWPPRPETDFESGRIIFCDRSSGNLLDQNDTFYASRPLTVYGNTQCLNMPWIGLFDWKRGDGVMQLVETPTDALIWMQSEDHGRIWPQVEWKPSLDTFRYPRRISYRFSASGGYVGLAKLYRNHLRETGRLKTFEQKFKERPNVARLAGAPMMWGSSDVEQFVHEARVEGILRATLLNAQHNLRHEGALRALNEQGYLTGMYDSYGDFTEGPLDHHTGPVAKQAYHERPGLGPKRGWVNPDGSSYFDRSSAFALETFESYVPRDQAQFGFNARFIDVHMAIELHEDWHPEHTFDRRQDLANRRAAYIYLTDHNLVVGTEHGNDWGVDVCDWFEGASGGSNWWTSSNGIWNPGALRRAGSPSDYSQPYLEYGANPRRQIPLWQLVYQDCTVSTFYWGDGADFHYRARPDIADHHDLINILYGTLPQLWRDKIGFDWNINRTRFMRTYHDTTHLQSRVMTSEMLNHEFISEDQLVQRSEFSNGTRVVVNFSDTERAVTLHGGRRVTLAPRGYVAEGPGFRQERLMEQGVAYKRFEYDDFKLYSTDVMSQLGPVELAGTLSAFRLTPERWQLVVDSTQTCRLNLRQITSWNASKPVNVIELSSSGDSMRYLDQILEGDSLALPPDGGPRRYFALIQGHGTPSPLAYPARGLIDTTQGLVLSHTNVKSAIHYTLDGTEPTPDSFRYTAPIRLQQAARLRARAFEGTVAIAPETSTTYAIQRELYHSPVLRWNEPPSQISVDLRGVQELRIRVRSAGQSIWADWLDLGEAELITIQGERMRLADLDPIRIVQTNRVFARNTLPDGSPMMMRGRVFHHGLALAAEGEYTYVLAGQYTRLEGWAGIDDASAPNMVNITGAATLSFESIDRLPEEQPSANIVLTPETMPHPTKRERGMRPGTDLYHLAFRAKAPWMSDGIMVRLPEVLQSHRGVHYIDHYIDDLWPLNEPEPFPMWETDGQTGSVTYTCRLPEGLEFGARAVPCSDEVQLEFWVTNHTKESLGNLTANPCLILGTSPEFNSPRDLTKLYAYLDGQMMRLSDTTPTPAQVGRPPWLLMLMRNTAPEWQGGKDSPTWWLLDQLADLNLMAAESTDGQHLLGYTWDHADRTMMSNGGNPCLHTGPGPITELKAGQTVRYRGRIYFVNNDPDELLERARRDHATWNSR